VAPWLAKSDELREAQRRRLAELRQRREQRRRERGRAGYERAVGIAAGNDHGARPAPFADGAPRSARGSLAEQGRLWVSW